MPRRYKPNPLRVPTAILREAFEHSHLTAAEVAADMGWFYGHSADSSRVKRTLGLIPETSTKGPDGKRYRQYRKTIDIDVAEQIGWIIGLEPWEIQQRMEELQQQRMDEAA
jgi:hypothetical protein